MKKLNLFYIVTLLVLLAFLWAISRSTGDSRPKSLTSLDDLPSALPATLDSPRPLPTVPSDRSPSSAERPEATEDYALTFANHVPMGATPSQWKHEITYQDDKYVGTQLKFKNKKVDTYLYKWKKINETGINLISGLVPTPKGIKGKFLDVAAREKAISAHQKEGLTVETSEDVWTIGYDAYLYPRIKVNVQYLLLGRIKHESWYLDTQGQIVNVRNLNRY